MSEYRHITNLSVPPDEIDIAFLRALHDYRVGGPVPADPVEVPNAKTLEQLYANKKIIGIYTTWEAVSSDAVRRLSGWNDLTREKFDRLPDYAPYAYSTYRTARLCPNCGREFERCPKCGSSDTDHYEEAPGENMNACHTCNYRWPITAPRPSDTDNQSPAT